MAFDFIESQLLQRRKEGLYRKMYCAQTKQGREIAFEHKKYLNFSSNDYLGLGSSRALINAWKQAAERYGVGSGGSFLMTGYTEAHLQLCEEIKSWLGVESVALFSSGYCANQAIIKLLFLAEKSQKNDYLIQDKLNHASLIEAGILIPSKMKRFKHNDLEDLGSLLTKINAENNNKLIISEGVFSMDGDKAPVQDLAELSKKHDAWLMIDDAHGIGVLGEEGRGCVYCPQRQGLLANIYMATFGKALGVGGAFVAGNHSFIEYLINFSKTYIYTTSFPPAMAYTILAAIKRVRHDQWRRDKLNALISHFRVMAQSHHIRLENSNTAIQPIIIGSSSALMRITQSMKNQGFWVSAIRAPSVAKGRSRLRITLTANHDHEDIERLVQALKISIKNEECLPQ